MAQIKSKKRKFVLSDIFIGAALFIITGIMPLIVRQTKVDMPPELIPLIPYEKFDDFFAYWKTWFLFIPVLLVIFYFISDIATGGRRFNFKNIIKNPPAVMAAVYIFFVLLSDIFTEYRHTALWGTYERCEGLFVQLAYIAVFFISMYYVREQKHVKPILAGLVFSALIMGAIGASQLLQYDFFRTGLAGWLVSGQWKPFNPKFTIAYGTVYNPNTFSLYTSMMAPFLLLFGFTYKGHKAVKALLLAAALLMLAGLAGSRSLGGMLGMAAASGIMAVTYITYLIAQKKRPPRPVWATALAILVILAAAGIGVPPVRKNIADALVKLYHAFEDEKQAAPTDYAFEDGTLRVFNGETTYFVLSPQENGEWLTVWDGADNEIPAVSVVSMDEYAYSTWQYDIPGYGRIELMGTYDFFTFEGMYLGIQDGNIIAYRQSRLVIDTSQPIEKMGFEGRETWGTMRGYIWSRSFPLMLKYPILGSGSDSFINVFPQDDIIGKKRFYNNPYMLIDKAHNLYFQTWITTGGISMLALVSLLGYYLVTTFLSLVRGKETALFGQRLGILAAVGAFAVSSMATDSTIGSTGVLYAILGLGFALNAWVKKNS